MDFFAIASSGVYPSPASTAAQRAAFAVTYGLFGGPLVEDSTPAVTTIAGIYPKFFGGYWCCERYPHDRQK